MTDTLTLGTAGLFSKYGFNDGDCPDQVYDWLEEPGNDGLLDFRNWSWQEVLTELVSDHLVPWLGDRVEVHEIGTIHNPIRARTMDHVDVDDMADNAALVAQLPIGHVEVHRDVVLATIRRHQAAGEVPC